MSRRPPFQALTTGRLSFSHPRHNRGSWRGCCNEIAFKLKPIVIGLIAFYYLYLDGVQRNKNRWKDERVFCYVGKCDGYHWKFDDYAVH